MSLQVEIFGFNSLQSVSEATINMAFVTHRALKTSTSKITPESGRVKVSLQVKDERWKHRLGQWDPESRTFTEVRLLTRIHFYFRVDFTRTMQYNCVLTKSEYIQSFGYCM